MLVKDCHQSRCVRSCCSIWNIRRILGKLGFQDEWRQWCLHIYAVGRAYRHKRNINIPSGWDSSCQEVQRILRCTNIYGRDILPRSGIPEGHHGHRIRLQGQILQHRRQEPSSGQCHLRQSWRRLQDPRFGLRRMPRTLPRRGERIDGEIYHVLQNWCFLQ